MVLDVWFLRCSMWVILIFLVVRVVMVGNCWFIVVIFRLRMGVGWCMFLCSMVLMRFILCLIFVVFLFGLMLLWMRCWVSSGFRRCLLFCCLLIFLLSVLRLMLWRLFSKIGFECFVFELFSFLVFLVYFVGVMFFLFWWLFWSGCWFYV